MRNRNSIRKKRGRHNNTFCYCPNCLHIDSTQCNKDKYSCCVFIYSKLGVKKKLKDVYHQYQVHILKGLDD